MSQGTKLLGQVIVYLLVLSGVAVMLLPFVWMLVTSFKLPSEVEKWPPQWTTKNLLTHRTLNVEPSFGAAQAVDFSALSFKEFLNLSSFWSKETNKNTVMLKIDDDPVLRGELHIKIEPNDVPISIPPLSKFRSRFSVYEASLPPNIAQIYENTMRGVSDTEDFLDRFFELFLFSKKPLLGRDFLPETMAGTLKKTENLLKRYGGRLASHPSLRPTQSDEPQVVEAKKAVAEVVKETVKGFEKGVEEFTVSLDDYKKGLSSTLSMSELGDLLGKLRGLLKWDLKRRVEEKLSYIPDFGEGLFSFYESRFVEPVRSWINLIELFRHVWKSYKEIQNDEEDQREIVVRLKTPKELKQEIKQAVEEEAAFGDDRELILKLVEKKELEEIVDGYIGRLNERLFDLMDNHNYRGDRQALLMSLNDLINGIQEFAPIEEIDTLVDESKTWGELEDGLRKLAGDNELLAAKLDKFKNVVKNDFELARQLFTMKWIQSKRIRRLSELVADIKNSTIPVSLPNTVKAVRYVGGKTIEIDSKYHRVWLYDSRYSVQVRFTPKEVFLNFFQNYVDAWKAAPFGRYYINTVFVATTTTILEVIVASMAAFAFAKLDFFGRDFLFSVYLATMMVPGEVLLVPNYITLTKFGWIDTYYALIVPWIVQVFAVFLMRQHFMTLPDELFDAAKIDGASKWRFLWTVVLPLSKPVVITAALLKFVGSWNAFLWVLIVTKSPEMRTLPVGLQNFSSEVGTLYNQLMAASTFSMLPVILLFLFTQRYFIRGIARTGLK